MAALRWLGIVLGGLVALLVVVFIGARFADGPVAIIPGGPLSSGELVEKRDVDWTFATDTGEIELESSGRSRTTWILVLDRSAYVPVSLDFPPGKSWHHEALEAPAAVVRVDGKRYRRTLVRVDDEPTREKLSAIVSEKYGGGPSGNDLSRAWFFELAPPADS
ncbi:MAG: hypothetical protein AAF430_17590 [Myxococcota bacterium]